MYMSLCPGNPTDSAPVPARRLGDLLAGVIKNLAGQERLGEEEISWAWKEAAGKAAARHSRPVSFRRAVLIVNVENSSWLYELTVRRRRIIAALEAALEDKKIKDIRFRIGDIKEGK